MGASFLTTLDAALAGVTALGIDTAPFIYFVESHPSYIDVVREVFRRVDTGTIAGYSSVITITEVLTVPLASKQIQLAADYRSLLLGSRNFIILPIDALVAEKAAELRARYRLRTPDALQIAITTAAGCEAFLTNDRTLRRVTEIRVLVLDELER